MKKRNLIYIVIALICIFAIFAGVYYEVFKDKSKKKNDNNNQINNEIVEQQQTIEETKEEFEALFTNKFDDQGYEIEDVKKIPTYDNKEIVFSAVNLKKEEENYNINVNIPVINIYDEITLGYNKITNQYFINKANNIIKNSQDFTIYNIDYAAYLNENILSVVIKSTLKEGNNPQRVIVQTYNYNIETKEEVKLNDVLEANGIDLKEVNQKIERQVKEANKQAEAISEALIESGQSIFKRDLDNAMYVTDNASYFFVGKDGQIYIIYPYGNSNFTSEIDIIKI